MTDLPRYRWRDVTGVVVCPACVRHLFHMGTDSLAAIRCHPDGKFAKPSHPKAFTLYHSKCGTQLEVLPGGCAVLMAEQDRAA